METTNVEDRGLFYLGPYLGLFEVIDRVFVCGRQVGAHATVVTCDDDTAAAGGMAVDDLVFGVHTFLFAGFGKGIGIGVTAYGADVPY